MSNTPVTDANTVDSHGVPLTAEEVVQNELNKKDPYRGGFVTFVNSDVSRQLEEKLGAVTMALRSRTDKTNESWRDGEPFLHNYADSVSGHYCISRYNIAGKYMEFYNQGKWCSAGEVFVLRLPKKEIR